MPGQDRVFRTRARKLGGHWTVRVFSAPRPDHTFAKLGELTMDEDDYREFCTKFRAEHLPEET